MPIMKNILKASVLGTILLSPIAISHASTYADSIAEALANNDRTPTHLAFDPNRKPAEILKFAGVKNGMTVLDINASRGYYSEILSGVVGKNGKVIAHNGPAYWGFIKKQSPESFKSMPNVVELHDGNEAVTAEENSVDVALSALAYHDYYMDHLKYTAEDVMKINKSVYDALKPGGVYVVIDHVGPKDAPNEVVSKLHRIDPARVKNELVAAGFTFVEESKLLANPDNPADKSWFGAKVRYSTDRFIYKFKK
ncbi:hypothetical protein QGN29_12220 [Temperatibacter marinus]|uniref:Methyltransferase n=1 Tax=Temperatibacter marinus TaxID=1456591 RepID=A0AA52EGX8_9PROT|nr:hypothetical protein [Temperatibacter marinus]WND02314.1 hypothetical protein QGN29_12220 [Temperatibacter marinus]